MKQVHAAVLHRIGQTPRYELFPAPVAGDDEAVVAVTAVALKPFYEAGDVATSGSAASPTVIPAGDDGGGTSRLNLRLPEGLEAKSRRRRDARVCLLTRGSSAPRLSP